MKILLVRDVPGELNAQKMTYNIQEVGLATALRKKGHSCDIMWCSNDHKYREEMIESEGQKIKLYVVRSFDFLKNAWIKDADRIFLQYDILQVCEYNQMYTRHLAKKYPQKFVCYHGPYYSDFNKNYNRMAKLFDIFFVGRYRRLNTPFITKSGLAADYLRSKGIRNVTAIGVGLSPTLLESSAVEVMPELNAIEDINGLKLLYIGAIEPRRNALYLLDLLKKLKDEGLTVTLVLIGKYKSVNYQSQFEATIKKYDLKDSILYIPRVEQKYLGYVYRHCDIFLLPTIYDIYGMVLLEAMYYGIPTLTTVNGGSNMMIKDGENGFVFDNFNLKTWTDQIRILSEDKKLANTIGKNAHDTIVNEFTWDALADKFIEEYKKILK